MAMQQELTRRLSNAAKLRAYLEARPLQWLTMADMEAGCGSAWRSRLTQVRRALHAEQAGVVEWNQQNGGASRYRFVPHVPLGRDASEYRSQPELF